MNCGDSIRVVHPLFQEEDGGSIPTSPLQLHFGQIHYKLARDLVSEWHSRMPFIGAAASCSPCYGAEFDGVFYAVAMWSVPIAGNRIVDGFKKLELRRMAIAEDAPKNTATRMLSFMRKDIKKTRPDIIGLLSYQDTEVHKGTIYKAAGWEIERVSDFVSWGERGKGRIDQVQSQKIRWGIKV